MVLALMLLLVINGCSSTRFFYSQLDWLIPTYVGNYVSLDDDQTTLLDQRLESLLSWHCSVQLPRYAEWFQRFAEEAAAKRLDYRQLDRFYQQLSVFWFSLLEQAAVPMSDILYNFEPYQVQELFDNLSDDNLEFKEELVDASADDIQQELTDRMEERLERWLDELTDQQREMVMLWSLKVKPLQSERLASRLRWQQAFRQLFEHREDRQQFVDSLTSLFRYPDRLWSASYRQHYEESSRDVLLLFEQIFNTITTEQHQYLIRRLQLMADDLNNLSCVQKTPV